MKVVRLFQYLPPVSVRFVFEIRVFKLFHTDHCFYLRKKMTAAVDYHVSVKNVNSKISRHFFIKFILRERETKREREREREREEEREREKERERDGDR